MRQKTVIKKLLQSGKEGFQKVGHELQSMSGITMCDRSFLQSALAITKRDRLLLQSASDITKCDRLLLQSESGITKCDSYYKVRHSISPHLYRYRKWYSTQTILASMLEK